MSPGWAGTDLLQKQRAYVKLSGLYFDSKVGPPTDSDSVTVAAAFAKAAPQRTLWGSDWPHPTEQASNRVPDDALLLPALPIQEGANELNGGLRVLFHDPVP